MEPMIVVTVKRDGGTQDVMGFYNVIDLALAMGDAGMFLRKSLDFRRAIVRIELYNPKASPVRKE